MDKIKIIIADDNRYVCNLYKEYLEKYEDIKILGIANTDEQEIDMIENLKPEIVITDLMRNRKYTALEIIKDYFERKKGPEFLVISSDIKSDVIKNGLEVAGYIQKPVLDYQVIYNEIRRIVDRGVENE